MPSKTKKPTTILPDMRGRLITDRNDPRYLQIVPAMPDMSWLNCPKCGEAPCACEAVARG